MAALNTDQLNRLQAQGFTNGLAVALADHAEAFAQRIWILDNSGSMAIGDGQRIVETSDHKVQQQAVSRWEELQQTVLQHVELAATLNLSTSFRFLNYPGDRIGVQEFGVVQQSGNLTEELRFARNIMQRTKPGGVTPLTDHIVAIERSIRASAHLLEESGRKVVVVIATDGLPTDYTGEESQLAQDEFITSLKSMEGLPVWLVVRLCTSDKVVTSFYNELDSKLELSLEVLDDHVGEAGEVAKHNKWLNYALPLHRCRELGFQHRLFDLIDERKLTVLELYELCILLFGGDAESWPDPSIDWDGFQDFLKKQLDREFQQWDPFRHKLAPWIDLRTLTRTYGKKGFLKWGRK